MGNITGTKEKAIRAAIKNVILTRAYSPGTFTPILPANFPIFISPAWIGSKQGYSEKFGIDIAGKTEFRYIWIYRAKFENDETEGCDDQPLLILPYTIRVFYSYRPQPENETEIESEYTDLVFALRTLFLTFPDVATGKINETNSFASPNDEQFGVDDVTGQTGFFNDFSLEVKYYAD